MAEKGWKEMVWAAATPNEYSCFCCCFTKKTHRIGILSLKGRVWSVVSWSFQALPPKSTKSAKCLCLSLSIELRTGGGHWCEHLLPGHCVIPLDFHSLPLFQFPHIHTQRQVFCLFELFELYMK